MTLAEFKETYRRSGESVMTLAHYAVSAPITDDDGFIAAAEAALEAEDKFYNLLLENDIAP